MAVAVWEAASGAPLRFLLSSWSARIWAFLVAGIAWGALVLAALFIPILFVAIGLTAVGVLLAVITLILMPCASDTVTRAERRRLGLLHERLLTPSSTLPQIGWASRCVTAVRDPASWRGLGYSVTAGLLAVVTGAIPVLLMALSFMLLISPVVVWAVAPDTVAIVPGRAVGGPLQALPASAVGLLGIVAAAYVGAAVAGVQVQLARGLLAVHDGDLDRRMLDLTRSQVRLVDAFAAERRRIERDLHDGAQQQLVAVTITLGLAELELAEHELLPGTTEAARLVARAKVEAAQALQQLRDLVQGVHEQILTDHGLPEALSELARRGHVPVTLDVDIDHRLGDPVETTAYFAVAEALTNAAKHGHATSISVSARVWDLQGQNTLVIEVTDNGIGGADVATGSGLRGIADRLAVLAGRLTVASPRGGHTTIRAEIPCP